ncbi:hypothetical protein D3C86_1396610 [compost metagenome]
MQYHRPLSAHAHQRREAAGETEGGRGRELLQISQVARTHRTLYRLGLRSGSLYRFQPGDRVFNVRAQGKGEH